MRIKLLITAILAVIAGISLWAYEPVTNNEQPIVVTFEECVAGGNVVTESYPRQCRLINGQTFTESFGPRTRAFQACATADIPLVSIDTVLDAEEGSVEVRWNDPETGAEKFLLLPYDPLSGYEGCSDSAKRVLQNISHVDALPTEIPRAASLARTYVAQRVKVNESEVLLVSVVQKDWSNACLGMPGNAPEDEFCAEVITPGYEVILNAGGREFIYRTNMEGTEIRPAN